MAQGTSKLFVNRPYNLHGHRFHLKADSWKSWRFGDTVFINSQEPLCETDAGHLLTELALF